MYLRLKALKIKYNYVQLPIAIVNSFLIVRKKSGNLTIVQIGLKKCS